MGDIGNPLDHLGDYCFNSQSSLQNWLFCIEKLDVQLVSLEKISQRLVLDLDIHLDLALTGKNDSIRGLRYYPAESFLEDNNKTVVSIPLSPGGIDMHVYIHIYYRKV